MIAELKKALQKARSNPRYLWYFFQNVNIARDHFPNLYRRYMLRKSLDMGSPTDLCKTHVILWKTGFVTILNVSRLQEDFGTMFDARR